MNISCTKKFTSNQKLYDNSKRKKRRILLTGQIKRFCVSQPAERRFMRQKLLLSFLNSGHTFLHLSSPLQRSTDETLGLTQKHFGALSLNQVKLLTPLQL